MSVNVNPQGVGVAMGVGGIGVGGGHRSSCLISEAAPGIVDLALNVNVSEGAISNKRWWA
jgi:hypothetical protein